MNGPPAPLRREHASRKDVDEGAPELVLRLGESELVTDVDAADWHGEVDPWIPRDAAPLCLDLRQLLGLPECPVACSLSSCACLCVDSARRMKTNDCLKHKTTPT